MVGAVQNEPFAHAGPNAAMVDQLVPCLRVGGVLAVALLLAARAELVGLRDGAQHGRA